MLNHLVAVTFLDAVSYAELERWDCVQVPATGQFVGLGCEYWYQVGRVQWHGPYRVDVYVTQGGQKL